MAEGDDEKQAQTNSQSAIAALLDVDLSSGHPAYRTRLGQTNGTGVPDPDRAVSLPMCLDMTTPPPTTRYGKRTRRIVQMAV
jgi:hypothetical protein